MIDSNGPDTSKPGPANGAGGRYVVQETPLGEAMKKRIIVVGAGASGLNLAHRIDQYMENLDLIIYEKNPEVGGTWYENSYSRAPEILEYFRGVARKYDLYRFIKLSHRVISADWDDEQGIWKLKIEDLATGTVIDDWGHFMITASGVLNNWKWPDIPGLYSFQGQLVHSANWDNSVDWTGKKVAVLGCGSSGIQIVPTIQPDVKHLTTFIRTPTWITAGFAQSKAGPGGSNFKFSEEQKKKFRTDPKAYLQYRKEVEQELNVRFKFIIKDSPEQAEAVRFSIEEMTSKLGNDSPLVKALVPSFAVGCRRPTPGNGYLEALLQDNVRVVTDTIAEVVPEGIKLSTGEVVAVDIFICATGFDISFRPRYPVHGLNGIALSEQWKDRPKAYLSLAVPNFPNHFMFLGPSSPVGHGSLLPLAEHATKYMLRMIRKAQTQDIKSVVVTQEAVDDFNEHVDEYMKRTAWSTHCRSWFKNGTIDGPIVALHPGSRLHWFHMLDEPRYEDYIWRRYHANRFAYLGNGFSTKEADGKDTTLYFDHPEKGFECLTG
ncbi:Flavin monooxygenase-like protein [Niveomyces insectorum RCEF 264]|uniref:Flavin monooxygenase-like protein n=1 Tax=Niveomyces insectorum RCEF 264 TaxID=1081102 RepID=A0A167SLN3_9HYPO|nr:Flavin monooxygenase-like protein [Niveomyces insectorum RCEF 264]